MILTVKDFIYFYDIHPKELYHSSDLSKTITLISYRNYDETDLYLLFNEQDNKSYFFCNK